jgi:hypothetical protein
MPLSGTSPPNLVPRSIKQSHPADPIFAARGIPPKVDKEVRPDAAVSSPVRLKKSSRMGKLPPPTPNAGKRSAASSSQRIPQVLFYHFSAGTNGEKFGILADLSGTVYSSR